MGMLPANARIAVIAPAGVPETVQLAESMTLLADWGFRVVEGRHLHEKHRYNAGTVLERSADLSWALTDPQIDAVWLARGGYGCVHCLPHLPVEGPADRTVIGSSDATALLVALRARGHRNLIHGPMLESLARRIDVESRRWMHDLLAGRNEAHIDVTHVCGPREDAAGPLIGGNLTVLASIAGTPFSMDSAGGIVLLEDVGEALYRLDRYVMQLRLSGAFERANAILLGQFTRCPPAPGSIGTWMEVLRDLLEPLDIPVLATDAIGHGERNLAWRYGRPCIIRGASLHLE